MKNRTLPQAACRQGGLPGGMTSMLLLVMLITACSSGDSTPPPPTIYSAFKNPELVTISGYTGDAMEPFISRDGNVLFFNNSGGATEKDIFYATMVDATTFQFQGALTAINTAAVDGTPTMDSTNNFYYISTANYNSNISAYNTIYRGTWTGITVTGITVVPNLAVTTPGFINFDVEVSADGTTLYFNDGDFSGGNDFPGSANIAIAVDSGSGFVRLANSSSIMAKVNTFSLEYAPAISADQLELFFTRYNISGNLTEIYRAVRANTSAAFETPLRLTAFTGFVEGVTLSPDEKSLYYHRLNPVANKFEIYRVTRP